MKVLVSYRGIPQSPGWATGDMVVKAFRALGHEAYPYAKYYQENRWVEGKPLLDEHDWDLILFMECNDGDPQYHELQTVRARKTACWLFDTSYYADNCERLVRWFNFDYIFLANPLTIQHYKSVGYDNVHYLPYACDSELHGRPLGYPKIRDVALVGSIRDDRRALAREIGLSNIDLHLISDVYREDYIDALASSRIIINQNPDQGRGLLNMRYWEAQAAGSVLLTESTDRNLNGIVKMEGEHSDGSIGYHDAKEIAFLAKTILENEEGRIEHCKNAQEKVFADHTYQNRCDNILDIIFQNERN